jgi:hypothetical protein
VKPLTDEARDRAAGCFPLAMSLIGRHTRKRMRSERRDAIYDGAVDGLLRAAAKYDPAYGLAANTYVGRTAVLGGAKSAARYDRRRGLVSTLPPAAIRSVPARLEDECRHDEAVKLLTAVLPLLRPRQRAALEIYYGLGGREKGTVSDVAASDGKGYAAAKSVLTNAKLAARREAGRLGLV